MATLNSSIEAILENVNTDITDPNTTKDGLITQLRNTTNEGGAQIDGLPGVPA